MPIPSNPPSLAGIIGVAADVLPIPAQDYTDPTQNGALNYTSGWPPITAIPLEAGGKAPRREYFNALAQLLSSHIFFQQSGSLYLWSASLDYLPGAHIQGSNGMEYIAVSASGPDTPKPGGGGMVGPVDPVSDGGSFWKTASSVFAPLATTTSPGIMQVGGGLAVTPQGIVSVDFSQMPPDQFEAILKQLRVPIWLSKNTDFYVNGTTGSDTLDDGRGLSAENPFKTIQACINYVCDTYNFSVYTTGINIAAGTYTEWLTIPNFNTLTGQLLFRGAGAGQTLIRGSVLARHGTGIVSFQPSLTIQCPEQTTPGWPNSWYGIGLFGAGSVDVFCVVDAGIANPSLYKYALNSSEFGGAVNIGAGASLVGNCTNFLATIGGAISISNDFSINGSIVGNGCCAIARNGGKILVFNKPDGVSFPVISGSVVGTRYVADVNGVINTAGRGPNFFPGTIAGVVNSGGVYV